MELLGYRLRIHWYSKARSAQDEWVSLFDGESFQSWEGNLRYFRVEDQALIGGFLHASIPRNHFSGD